MAIAALPVCLIVLLVFCVLYCLKKKFPQKLEIITEKLKDIVFFSALIPMIKATFMP